ncbi:polysaccharide lyase [Mycobacterium sp. NPDC050041]|uniref:polysaccharide lyase n=1 Tax=Mycobacterium sp. NPDC050041 TaxID=3364293 RepID=UPI003C2C04A0
MVDGNTVTNTGTDTARIGRRTFARLSLAAAAAVAGGCAVRPTEVATPPRGPAPAPRIVGVSSELRFLGDYSTGDFRQWSVQCPGYNGPGAEFPGSSSAEVVPDPQYGHAARFEVRRGDVPPFGGGERSEVSGDDNSGGRAGQERWYRFATRFDPGFPGDHADLGWGVTNQWHGDADAGSPPLNWGVGEQNGQWTLLAARQSAPGQYLDTVPLFRTPLDAGRWHDVKMHVRWSTSDEDGFVELWLDGARQTFTDGSTTYRVRTLIPGTPAPSVYYKEGYYRQNDIAPTGIVHHAGFRCAETEGAL